MKPQPLIAVSDVETSSRWYQRLLGCNSGHGGREYERLMSGDELNFDAAVSRARALGVELLEEPHTHPNAGQREVWLRDPDGYVVVLAGEPGQ